MHFPMHTPHCFGEYENLFGYHCESAICNDGNPSDSSYKPVVLMLTAGMLTNIGPSRLHVRMADELSRKGIPSFRFDLSGIGESLAVGSKGSSLQRAANEVQQAMDMLEREYGYTHFMPFGLCSGADDAIMAATEDPRIVAASLLDPCGYRTPSHFSAFLRRKYLPKVLSINKWISTFGQRFQRGALKASTMPQGLDIREFPNREQSENAILALIDRGVRLQFIYTGGVIDYYSYANQFFDMFPRLRNRNEVSVQFEPKWDHVAMLDEDRTELLRTVVTWFESAANSLVGTRVLLPVRT